MKARQKFFQALREYRYSEDFARAHDIHGHGVTGDLIKLYETFEEADRMAPPLQEEVDLFQKVSKIQATRLYRARTAQLSLGNISAACLILAEGNVEDEHDVPTLRIEDRRIA